MVSSSWTALNYPITAPLTHTVFTFLCSKFIHILKPKSWWWIDRADEVKRSVKDDLKVCSVEYPNTEICLLSPVRDKQKKKHRYCLSSMRSEIQEEHYLESCWISLEGIRFWEGKISEWFQGREAWLYLIADYYRSRRGLGWGHAGEPLQISFELHRLKISQVNSLSK